MRRGRKLRARPVDDVPGQTQPPRDVNAAGTSRHADHQAIRGPQVHLVKFDRGVEHARRGRSVSLQPVVVRGRQRQAAARAEFVKQGDGERRAFVRRRAGAQLINQHERSRRGRFQHRAHIEHVRGKRRKVRGNGLFVADIHQTRSTRGIRADSAATGMPDCAARAARPTVLSATVFPPVLGPLMTSTVSAFRDRRARA